MRPRSLPPLLAQRPLPDWVRIIGHVILCQASNGRTWPEGTAAAIAAMVPPDASQDDAARFIEDELLVRDVGGRNTFAHGAGI